MWGGPVPKEITIFGQNAFCKYWLGGKMSHKNVLIIVKFHRRWLKDRATVHPFRRYCGTILTTLLWVYVPTKKIFWNTLSAIIYFWREREATNLIIRLIVRQQCRQYKHPACSCSQVDFRDPISSTTTAFRFVSIQCNGNIAPGDEVLNSVQLEVPI